MSRKKLPKAIRGVASDLDQTIAGSTSADRDGAVAESVQSDTDAYTDPSAGEGDASPRTTEPAPPVAQPLATRELPAIDSELMWRRRVLAHAIVERYAGYSAGGGFIPLPFANVAAVTAINLRMVKMLSNIYRVPLQPRSAHSIMVGLAAGAAPTGLGAATASMLSLFTPASTILALAVSSMTAAACTRRIGRVFVERFERGET